ncbi:hypothetical protein [Solirubrobacter soli]|uniref:hypothetical protein n=1 Tax=Solirubrobacter soli TaxID=363832 RepID=UPI000415E9EC|nr:hypothetical protein [Solirubrobacter soli]
MLGLGGTAVAKGGYLITKPNQIKPSVRAALKGDSGPQGIPGPQGPQGVQGPAGPAGSSSAVGVSTVVARSSAAPGAVVGAQAFCPAGKVVIGSGFYAGITNAAFVKTYGNSVGAGFLNTRSLTEQVEVQAICAPGAMSATATERGEDFQDELDALRSERP